jgi:alkylhydroperoxidase family enzyme
MGTGKRIPVELVREPVHPDAIATFEKLAGRQMGIGIAIANIHRTLANSPTVFANFIHLANALRNDTKVDPAERELAILAVLQRHGGDYEIVPHRRLGAKLGLTGQQLDHVSNPDAAGVYTPRQQAILRFALFFAADPADRHRHQDHGIEEYLDNRQRIELSLNLAIYMGLAHLTGVLDVPPDAELAGKAG